MQISSINSIPSFKAKNDKSKPYEIMDQLAGMFDTTTKNAGRVADVVIAAKGAMDSPEETTIRVLTSKVDDVVNDKKSPSWIKKPAKYIAAISIAGLTTIASVKALKAPGMALRFTKNQLTKFKFGKSLLNMAHTAKSKVSNLFNAFKIKDKNIFKSIADFFKQKSKSVSKYVKKHYPETKKSLNNLSKKLKLNKLSGKDYFRYILSAGIGLSSGKRYINKYEKNEDTLKKNKSVDNNSNEEFLKNSIKEEENETIF